MLTRVSLVVDLKGQSRSDEVVVDVIFFNVGEEYDR